MFNFSVVFADRERVIDTRRAITCRCNFKAQTLLKTRKNEESSKNMGFIKKILEVFRLQKSKTQVGNFHLTGSETKLREK